MTSVVDDCLPSAPVGALALVAFIVGAAMGAPGSAREGCRPTASPKPGSKGLSGDVRGAERRLAEAVGMKSSPPSTAKRATIATLRTVIATRR